MPVGDEAVRAFRKYARLFPVGRPRKNGFSHIESIRGCCGSDEEARRMLAVYEMLRLLRADNRSEIADAVEAVYFTKRGRTPRKNDITYRVRVFSDLRHMDERTVWRRLDEAKSLYYSLAEN